MQEQIKQIENPRVKQMLTTVTEMYNNYTFFLKQLRYRRKFGAFWRRSIVGNSAPLHVDAQPG